MAQFSKRRSGPATKNVTGEWFSDAPFEDVVKTGKRIILHPTSKIPGLSAGVKDEEKTQGTKKAIKEYDSDYVKLAKRGGHKDLLAQSEYESHKTSPLAYNLPEWYSDLTAGHQKEKKGAPPRYVPNYMVHEEFDEEQSEHKYKTIRGPIALDQETVRKPDGKKVKLPSDNTRFADGEDEEEEEDEEDNLTTSGKNPIMKTEGEKLGKKCFFPTVQGCDGRKGVNFGKLLSHGYGEDWLQRRDE